MKKSIPLSCAISALIYQTPVTAGEMEPVVVTATRTAQTVDQALATVSVITRQEIEQSGAQSIDQLLRTTSGIHITTNGGYGKSTGFYIRGTESDHVLVLIDGVRAASATLGTYAWAHLSLNQIEKIEIVRGGRSSLYGSDAIGGVIQIFTRKGGSNQVTVESGSYDTYQTTVSTGGEHQDWSWGVSAGYFETGGIPVLEIDQDAHGYNNRNFTVNTQGMLDSGTSIDASLTYASGTNQLAASTGNQEFQNYVLSTAIDHDFSEQWNNKLTLGLTQDQSQSFSPTSPSTITTKRESISWQHNFLLDDMLLTSGIDYWRDDVSKDDSGTIYQVIDNSGFYLESQQSISDFDLTVGARHDWHDNFSEKSTWNISAGRDINPISRIVASMGSSFKAPTVNDLYWPNSTSTYGANTYITEGNTSVTSEHSRSAEISIRNQLSATTDLDINFYHTATKDLIDWQSTQTGANEYTYQPTNVSNVTIKGVEIELSGMVNEWQLEGALTFMSAKNDDTQKQLDRRPKRTFSLQGRRSLKGGELSADALWVDERNDRTAAVQLGSYLVTNLSYQYPIDHQLLLKSRLENLLDREYTIAQSQSGNYNTLGRTISVGLEYSF